jgi:hypothetical protein
MGYDVTRVLDSDKTSVVYTINNQSKKPQLTIQSTSTNATIGTFVFHTWTCRIDATVHNHSFSMTTHGLFKPDYSYESPAFGSMKMTWKPRKKTDELNMVLLDDQAMPVARFEPSNWALKKNGKMELLGPSLKNEEVMDEVVATGLAVIHYRQMQRLVTATAVAIS